MNYVAVQGISAASYNGATAVPLADMTAVIKTKGNPIEVNFTATTSSTTLGCAMYFRIYIDGVFVGMESDSNASVAGGYEWIASISEIIPVSAGVHTVQVMWYTAGGAGSIPALKRFLTVKELGD